MDSKNKGIVFLTYTPNQYLLEFAEELSHKTNLLVFIIADNNQYVPEKRFKNLVYRVDEEVCNYYNFKNINPLIKEKKVTAWNKVIYFLCREVKFLDFCWIVEDDVFIPSVESVRNLTKEYSKYDLVVPNDKANIDQSREYWHWYRMPVYMEKNYYNSSLDIKNHPEKSWHKSMVCAIGVSRRLLYLINLHVLAYKELFFLEAIFNTIAHQAELDIKVLENFETIKWKQDWKESDILEKPENWFHPMKDFSLHPVYREMLKIEK
jgi:hypothetical protein